MASWKTLEVIGGFLLGNSSISEKIVHCKLGAMWPISDTIVETGTPIMETKHQPTSSITDINCAVLLRVLNSQCCLPSMDPPDQLTRM